MLELNARTEAFLDSLTRMASGETQLQIPISPDHDVLDAIGLGINMLAAELRYTTLSRDGQRLLFDALLDLLVIIDQQGSIVQVNRAVLDRTGGGPDDWVGNQWTSLFEVGNASLGDLTRRLVQGERLVDLEWSVRGTQGVPIPVLVSPVLLGVYGEGVEDEGHILLLAKDMRATYELLQRKAEIEAERRRATEFQRARDLAEEASRTKSTFLANVSHELRTPLTVVLSGVELLGMHDLRPEARAKCLSQVESSARRLRLLVNDLMDTARMETGSLSIYRKSLQLDSVFQEVVSNHEPVAAAKGLRLRFLEKGNLPKSIVTDALRFQQVLDNLIGNAIKFTRQGEVTLRVACEPAEDERERLRIDIIDSGIGIPADRLERLFRPFSQADDRVSQVFGGTGLGLALSRNLARLLGGDLRLAWTREGAGSCFVFTLPL